MYIILHKHSIYLKTACVCTLTHITYTLYTVYINHKILSHSPAKSFVYEIKDSIDISFCLS